MKEGRETGKGGQEYVTEEDSEKGVVFSFFFFFFCRGVWPPHDGRVMRDKERNESVGRGDGVSVGRIEISTLNARFLLSLVLVKTGECGTLSS